jgi:hypothetical protein
MLSCYRRIGVFETSRGAELRAKSDTRQRRCCYSFLARDGIQTYCLPKQGLGDLGSKSVPSTDPLVRQNATLISVLTAYLRRVPWALDLVFIGEPRLPCYSAARRRLTPSTHATHS